MRIILMVTVLMLALRCVGQEEQKEAVVRFTFEDCINYAYGNSYERQSLELTRQSQDLSLQQSKRDRLPSVSAHVSEGFSNSNDGSLFSGSAGIDASVSVYQGGSIKNNIEIQELALEQAGMELQQYDDNLSIQILQAFLSILGNEELLKYQEEVLNSSYEIMRQGAVKFEAGAMIESDYLLLEAQYATDTNNVVDTRIAIENSLLNLKLLMSMDASTPLEVILPDTADIAQLSVLPSLEEALSAAESYSPELKMGQYDIDIAGMNVKLSKSDMLPSVSVGAGLNTGHSGWGNMGNQLVNELSESVSLSLSIPIYNKGNTRLKVKQSEIELQRTQLSLANSRFVLRQTVTEEYYNVLSTYNKYKVSKLSADAYLKSFEAYNSQFLYGTITAYDLLSQQLGYTEALNSYIQNKYSFILQRKILDIYMGKKITF